MSIDERYTMGTDAYGMACVQIEVAAARATDSRSGNRRHGRWRRKRQPDRSRIERIVDHCQQPSEIEWLDQRSTDARMVAPLLRARLENAKIIPVAGWNVFLSLALRWVLPWLIDFLTEYFANRQAER